MRYSQLHTEVRPGRRFRGAVPVLVVIALSLIVSACSFRPKLPRVYKMSVQQGNVITQQMIDKLKPGMTRSQVAFIMGEPVFRNSFDDNRWDYIYSIEVPGIYQSGQTVSIYFIDDVLAYFTGDMIPTDQKEAAEEAAAAEVAGQDDVDTGSGSPKATSDSD